MAIRDARVGSTHATIRDHAGRDRRTHRRSDDPSGNHAKVDHRPEGRDGREREGGDAEAQGGLEEVPRAQGRDHSQAHRGEEGHRTEVAEARGRCEEGRDHEEAHDDAQDRSEEGRDHAEADHGSEGDRKEADDGAQAGNPEVAEACGRREEGGRHEEAQDGGQEDRRAQGRDHPEADHGAEGHGSEVAEACRRREEGRDRAQAEDGPGAEGIDDAPDDVAEDRLSPRSVAETG